MEYYSAIGRNESLNHQKTWTNLKCLMLSERSQSEKATKCMISTRGHSRKGKTMEMVNKSVLPRSARGGRVEDMKHKEFFRQ